MLAFLRLKTRGGRTVGIASWVVVDGGDAGCALSAVSWALVGLDGWLPIFC